MAVTQDWNVIAVHPVKLIADSVGLDILEATSVAEGQTAIGVNLAADQLLVGGATSQSVALADPGADSTLIYNSSASAGSRIEWQSGLPVTQESLTYSNASADSFTAVSGESYFFSGRAVSASTATDFWFGQISVYYDGTDVHSVVNGYIGSGTIQPFISNSGATVTIEFSTPGPSPAAVNVNGTLKYSTI